MWWTLPTIKSRSPEPVRARADSLLLDHGWLEKMAAGFRQHAKEGPPAEIYVPGIEHEFASMLKLFGNELWPVLPILWSDIRRLPESSLLDPNECDCMSHVLNTAWLPVIPARFSGRQLQTLLSQPYALAKTIEGLADSNAVSGKLDVRLYYYNFRLSVQAPYPGEPLSLVRLAYRCEYTTRKAK